MQTNQYDQLVKHCCEYLHSELGAHALSYVNNRIPPEIQSKFNIGFFPTRENLNFFLSFLDTEPLLENNLIYLDKHSDIMQEQFSSTMCNHNLIIPYKDVYGKIIALVGRSLLDEDSRRAANISKYKNTPFKKSQHMFGLYEGKSSILSKGFAYVVEGQFDVISAHAQGITNVVAIGSSGMAMDQIILLLRYTNDIRLLLDNDEAGIAGAKKIIEKFSKFTKITQLSVPAGFKDLDEFLSEVKIQDDKELESLLV